MSILITGADGFLGGKIIKKVLEGTDFDVIGLTRSMDYIEAMLERENITQRKRLIFLANDDFLKLESMDWRIDGVVHLAFSRRMKPAADIASSILFAANIFHKLIDCGADCVINMSSQGIYGNTGEIRTEFTTPAPANQYTMAKYAAEVLLNDIMQNCPRHTNLRLDLVAQSQNVLKGLCKSAKEGKLVLRGGKQVFSFIDAEDVSDAVIAMLKTNGDWDKAYNVGWNRKRYTIVELADSVADAAEKCGYKRPEIEITEDDTALWAGMDSTKFMEKTGWKPRINLEDTLIGMLNGEDMDRKTRRKSIRVL